MMRKSDDISSLLNMVERRFGRKPMTPGDFNELILSIYDTTRQNLSLSTVKRLWKYVSYPHSPSLSTLTTLAQYAGFQDWGTFCASPEGKDSAFVTDYQDFNNLLPGVRITLQWDPDKGCTLKHIDNNRFIVVESHNIKLREGDEVTADFFSIGQPICMKNIVRGEENIPIYYAAKTSGLKFIRLET